MDKESGRRMLERKRSLDYVTLQGLTVQTGCDPEDLDIFVLKELVDNALDACEENNPTIEVTFETDKFVTLTVKDSGKGLTEADVKRIVDFDRSYSTKFHYKYPMRGALGNALKCVLGIPYALSSECSISLPTEPIRVHSKGKAFGVHLNLQELEEQLYSQISSRDTKSESGTRVSIMLPLLEKTWGHRKAYSDLVRSYVLFNPEANFKLTVRHPKLDKPFIETHPSRDKRHKRFTGASSIQWYTLTQFKQLVQAYIRSILKGEKDLTLRLFIKQFRGLSSDKKAASILAEIQSENKEIKHLSDLAGQDKAVSQLYECMKKRSISLSSNVLGEIGKKQLHDRISQIYGIPLTFKYKKIDKLCREGSVYIPYVLEVAVAVIGEYKAGLRIHAGINHSPCLSNPFEGYHIAWMDKKENWQEASITRGLLEKYGIDSEQPVIVVVHLICPNIEYQSYGKRKINIDPFYTDFARTLTEICRFYPRYKRRKGSVSGKTSLARMYLIEELQRRQSLLEQHGKIPESERTTQQGIYYKIRNQMGGKIDILRSSFIPPITDECEKLGTKRADLGIMAAVRAELYFRGNIYPVSLENIKALAMMGSDVILVEKEGVCQVLEPYACRRGIALVNSRGFIVEYAKDLLLLSQKEGANLFTITDYDASGLLIAQKISTIPRLGVDLQMISTLNLKREDVEEKYKAPKKHLKPLPSHLQEEVKEKRIEIDAVLAAVGPKRLWSYLEKKMLELAPQRDLTRSADLTVVLPREILVPLMKINKFVRSVGASKQEDTKAKLRNWKRGFIDIEKVERSFQSKIIKIIKKDDRIQELAKQLNKLADSISKNPQKSSLK